MMMTGVLFLFLFFREPVSILIELKSLSASATELYNDETDFIDVLHYKIELELFPEKKYVKGQTIITLRILPAKNSDKISLDFYDNMKIETLEINGTAKNFLHEDNKIVISSSAEADSSYQIKIIYSGSPKSKGLGSFNFAKYHSGENFVYTLNEPIFAPTWFPCNDKPDDKAKVDIIITNDSSMVSVSNGLLIDIKKIDSRKVYHWRSNYPTSTYLIGFYSASYKEFSQEYISLDSSRLMTLHYYVMPDKYEDALYDFSVHPDILTVLSKLFGEYPFIDEKYGAAQFLWNYGAMEHQSITGIGTNFISGKGFHKDLYIHETAHHWWGNAVGPKSWKDIWLNEGFAKYSEALYHEVKSGRNSLKSSMLAIKQDFEDETVYYPRANLFSRVVYDKGAWVLHMLRREISDTIFFYLLRGYFEKYKYTNASTDDFKNIAEKFSGISLHKFFDQWVYSGKGIIEIDYKFKIKPGDNAGATAVIYLNQIQDGYDSYSFPLDIKFMADSHSEIKTFYISSRETVISADLSFTPDNIFFDPEDWLLARFQRIDR